MQDEDILPPVPDPVPRRPSKLDELIIELLRRLPASFTPGWLLAALGLFLAAVVALAYVAGVALAAIGGAVGLAAIIGASRKKS